MFPKNQQNRRRGETLGEAGADWPFGFSVKPMLDEKPRRGEGEGLRGDDKQQAALRDASGNGARVVLPQND
jgi:hypothetical protein